MATTPAKKQRRKTVLIYPHDIDERQKHCSRVIGIYSSIDAAIEAAQRFLAAEADPEPDPPLTKRTKE
jgi:ABC-type Mn2+/Zn2+ transport system ATPase subunit